MRGWYEWEGNQNGRVNSLTYAVVYAVIIFCGDKRKKTFKGLSVALQSCLSGISMKTIEGSWKGHKPLDRLPWLVKGEEFRMWMVK